MYLCTIKNNINNNQIFTIMKCKRLNLKVSLVYDETVHSYTFSDKGFNRDDFTHIFNIDICYFGESAVPYYFIIKSIKSVHSSIRPFFVPIPISLDGDYNPAVVDQALSILSFNPYSPLVHKLICSIRNYILTL